MEPTAKKRRGCLLPFIVIIFILAALFVVIVMGVGSMEVPAAQSLLAKTMDLTEQQEQDLLAVFEACGMGEVTSIQTIQEGEDYTSYWLDDSETSAYKSSDYRVVAYVSNDTKELRDIYFHNRDIYVDGQVVGQITDYYISSEQRDEYRVAAQLMVCECLSYPDTAKFGSISKWAFDVNDDGYDVVQSSVTAKNAFGVESTENFQLLFDRVAGVPISLILDGTEYIK